MIIQNFRWILSGIVITGLLTNSAMGANSSFCKKYATKAVEQFYTAKFHKLNGINPPAWSNDYEGHKEWCEHVANTRANNETSKRQKYLEKFINDGNTQKNVGVEKRILPNGIVEIHYPDGRIKKRSDEENIIVSPYYSNVIKANPPEEPTSLPEFLWLLQHANILMDVIEIQVNNDKESLLKYEEYEKNKSKTIYDKINIRGKTIKYLTSP